MTEATDWVGIRRGDTGEEGLGLIYSFLHGLGVSTDRKNDVEGGCEIFWAEGLDMSLWV